MSIEYLTIETRIDLTEIEQNKYKCCIFVIQAMCIQKCHLCDNILYIFVADEFNSSMPNQVDFTNQDNAHAPNEVFAGEKTNHLMCTQKRG